MNPELRKNSADPRLYTDPVLYFTWVIFASTHLTDHHVVQQIRSAIGDGE